MATEEQHEHVIIVCQNKEAESHLSYFPGLEIRVRRFCEHIRTHDKSHKQGSSDVEHRPLVNEDSVSTECEPFQPSKGEECCVCLQVLEPDAQGEGKTVTRCCVMTRCGHFYHPTCLSDAFTRVPSHSCPSQFVLRLQVCPCLSCENTTFLTTSTGTMQITESFHETEPTTCFARANSNTRTLKHKTLFPRSAEKHHGDKLLHFAYKISFCARTMKTDNNINNTLRSVPHTTARGISHRPGRAPASIRGGTKDDPETDATLARSGICFF
jgi:hypothetical protein